LEACKINSGGIAMGWREKEVHQWTPDDWEQFREHKLNELPREFRDDCVSYLAKALPLSFKVWCLKEYGRLGSDWFIGNHHGTGTEIRNMLRKAGFTDDKLPDTSEQNWDDYYIPVLECAVGIRDYNK
jgi:hypothetical protein